MGRIGILVKKEFVQIARDRRAVAIILLMPLMFLFLFGYAGVRQVTDIPTAVLNRDGGQAAAAVVRAFQHSGYFDVRYSVPSEAALQELMDQGRVQAGIIIPHRLDEALFRGQPGAVQLVVDGTDPVVVASAVPAFTAVAHGVAGALPGAAPPPLQGHVRVWYNPELRDINFFINGLVGAILLQVTLVLTSQAIVREREKGTMERLISSPLRPAELVLGKLIPYALIAVWDLVLIFALATLWFRVPMHGHFGLFFAATILYIFSCLGFGLFISTISHTQQQAIQLSMLVFLPSLILSGFIYPIAAMPRAIQLLTYLLPLRYYITIARAVTFKGVSLPVVLPELAAMTGVGLVVLALSIVRFTRRFA